MAHVSVFRCQVFRRAYAGDYVVTATSEGLTPSPAGQTILVNGGRTFR